jgi:hypothetical protein
MHMYKILVGKLEQKRLFARSSLKKEDLRFGLNSSNSGQGPGGKFLD